MKIVSNGHKNFIQEKSPQVVDEIFQITFGYNREIITKVKTKEFKSSFPGIEEIEAELEEVRL